ncbi:MAG TPA: hypothetical protein VM782_14520, partial [Stellaceae bacterium]|nr:hypothetical protein [Stellaceae bacterium]
GAPAARPPTDFWAVSQAAPMRRVQVNGLLSLMDYCNGSPDYASGGFIADSAGRVWVVLLARLPRQ